MLDAYSCKCRRCGDFHNNERGDGVCSQCRYGKVVGRIKREVEVPK